MYCLYVCPSSRILRRARVNGDGVPSPAATSRKRCDRRAHHITKIGNYGDSDRWGGWMDQRRRENFNTNKTSRSVWKCCAWNRTGDRSRHRSFSFVVGSWRRYPHYIFFLSPFDAPYRPILDSLVYSCNVVVVGLWSPSIPRPSPILHGHLLSTNAIRRKDPILFPLSFCSYPSSSSPSPPPPPAAAAAAAAAPAPR